MQSAHQPPDSVVVLTEGQCRALLAGAAVGRVGFTADALPVIAPVPFTVHQGRVVVPVPLDGQLASACRGAVVAFEVDSVDRADGSVWAVSVVGHSRVLTAPEETAELDALGLHPWGIVRGGCYVVVDTCHVTGWRVHDGHHGASGPADVDRAGASARAGASVEVS